jgi:putative protease
VVNANQPSVELLAPAGNWECARAAVENGADAIYFGLDAGFNARARAANFHLDELPDLIEMLHRQGVCGYVTLNTLAFTDELPRLEGHVRQLAHAGVDAVLVQDLGVVQLVKSICPDLSVHASTQMTLTNADAIEVVRELGIDRVVLARELSVKEIRKISQATDMPIEVFVHGALCVAYSGQCLTSESLGGRSANRGQCAQACRLPYELHCDGEKRDLGSVKYLLSPQDLAAHDLIPDLIEAGVCSLKIEGRLKTPEYVANVCAHYREAIDAALRQAPKKLTLAEQRELEMSFSRGFSPGWLEGCDHKRLVPGESSSKRGVELGRVTKLLRDGFEMEASAPVAVGEGIVIEGDRLAGHEVGGRIYALSVSRENVKSAEQGMVSVQFERGAMERKLDGLPAEVRDKLVGQRIWKTDDPQLTKKLRRSFRQADPQKRIAVSVQCKIHVGQPIEIVVQTPDLGEPLGFTHEFVPEVARKHAATSETVREQLSRLGGTVYRLEELECELVGSPMVPLSVLGQIRKRMLQELDEARKTRPLRCVEGDVARRLIAEAQAQSQPLSQLLSQPQSQPPEQARMPRKPTQLDLESSQLQDGELSTEDPHPVLRVLCRSLEQLRHVLKCGVKHLIADFHDLREYREAVQLCRAEGAEIELATLRIHKPGEDGLFHALRKHAADSWLVRNLAALRYCQQHDIPAAADFSLNVTNPLTAATLRRWGVTRVTTSYDLNRDQLIELVADTPSHWLEVVIHQHMPMFHMEHCVFCSVLSPGKNKTDCGRPCDRHSVELSDRVGVPHVLHADIGCRNTLYNGVAQSGAEAVPKLLELGVKQFRVELLKGGDQDNVSRTIDLYRRLIAGELPGQQVWRELKATNRVGVTKGTLEHPRDPLAIL